MNSFENDERPLPRILTTHEKKNHPEWRSRVEMLPGWEEYAQATWANPDASSLAVSFYWAWRLFRASKDYDVVITGSERPALLFALLQRFLRRKRVPHIFIECLWNLPENFLRRWRRKFLLRNVALAAARIIVHASRQVEAYEKAFHIPSGKFVFVRCHATLWGEYPVSEGDYVFVAGHYSRDWYTALEAVRGLPYRTVIGALSRDPFRGLSIPANVEITQFTPDAFRRAMAGARVVVVPLIKGLLHSGGHQGFENAMSMGKAVVVADEWAHDYLEDGVTGRLVPPGDVAALRSAIASTFENRDRARRMGRKAKEAAAAFAPECFFASVFELVNDCIAPGTRARIEAGCSVGA